MATVPSFASPLIGFHASHEQFSPRYLLELAQKAEQAGFGGLFSSDHFHPWGHAQGHSGFSFAWLGAALQATSLPARCICCPFGRYHPAIVAQAAATLSQMFEGRFNLAIGTGQALNEHITGEPWPDKSTRNAKLKESAEIIRALWAGETVTRHGRVRVEEARLYSRPDALPKLFGAAVTEPTAKFVGGWADGLLTTSRPLAESKAIIKSFEEGGGRGRGLILKVGLSYARSEELALQQAHSEWRNAAFPNDILTEVKTTGDFDRMGAQVAPEKMRSQLRVSADVDQHIRWLRDDLAAGFTEIYLHNVGRNQEEFIADFGQRVLPHLTS